MTLKQLIKLEDKAQEVWVVSPSLHYDVENKEFSELVSVNLGQKTKYKYIVPATKEINKQIDLYKKLYKLTDEEIHQNFLLVAPSDLTAFIVEIGIYNGSGKNCVACAAPALEDNNDVLQFNKKTSMNLAKSFKAIWKKYKRQNP
jgi:endonuclease III